MASQDFLEDKAPAFETLHKELKEELLAADEPVVEAMLENMDDQELVFLFANMQSEPLLASVNN